MMDNTYTVPARFGVRAMLLITAIIAVVFGITKAVDVELRVVAPVLSFVVLVCLAQIFFGRIPRVASAAVGAVVFPASAYVNPLFDGQFHIQPMRPIELFWFLVCGTIAGYLGGVLLAGMFLVSDYLQRERKVRAYSVPRRFGMGTLLLATTLFAIIFAVLNWANVRPWLLFLFIAFVGTVGAAQMTLERTPRWASILAGGVYLPLSLFAFVPSAMQDRFQFEQAGIPNLAGFIIALITVGLMLGYVGGTLISGVFLLSDHLVRIIALRRPEVIAASMVDDEPVGGGTLTRLAEQFAASRRP